MPPERDDLAVAAVARLRAVRAVALATLGPAVAGHPPWDVLLGLRRAPGALLPAAVACRLLPRWSSAVRWVRALQSLGLVSGDPRQALAPETVLRLTPAGREKVDACLAALS